MPATLVIVSNSEDRWGKSRTLAVDITLSGTYPLGGYTIDGAAYGFAGVIGYAIGPVNTLALNALAVYNPQTGNLQLMVGGGAGNALQEVTPGTNVAGAIYRALAIGY